MSGWQTRDPAHVGLDPADYTSALPFPKLNGAGDGFEPDAGGGGSATSAVTVPEDHSAVGDGTTDDTTALQAWLDDARPFKFLPANTYITDSLTVPSDVVIFGGGDGSVLKRRGVPQPDGGVLNIFGGAGIVSGVTVANLTVDGNKANVTASGNALNVECIDIKDATGIRLHNVTLRDATSDGVDLDDCTDVVIYACHAYDCGGWGFHFSHGTVENKLVGSVADNCGHDQDRGGIDQWGPSGGNPGGLRNSYIGNTARDCYRNYAIRGSGAVFIGNQSLGTTTAADILTGVADAGGGVDLTTYPSAASQPAGKVAETNGADGWTFIDTPDAASLSTHRLVVLHDFGTGPEPVTDAAGLWLYGAYPGTEH